MSRILAVVVVALAFGGALVYGGRAMGAWEPYEPVPDRAGTRASVQPSAAPKAAKSRGKRKAAAAKPSKSAVETWAARASAVCRKARPNVEVIMRDLGAAESPAEFGSALAHLVEANKRINADVRRIPAPPRQRARVAELHRLLARDERILAQMLDAFRQRDANALQALANDVESVAAKENEIFWLLGANECTVQAYFGDAGTLA